MSKFWDVYNAIDRSLQSTLLLGHVWGGMGIALLISFGTIWLGWPYYALTILIVAAIASIREYGQNKQWWGEHAVQTKMQMLWDIFEFTVGASITVLFMAFARWAGSLGG